MEKRDIGSESESISSVKGKIMALDLGDKRIGIAISDSSGTIARPLGVIKRKSRADDFKRIGKLLHEHDVVHLIIGLPTLASGEDGLRARWTRDYAHFLSEHVDMEVGFWDESFSTKDAEDSLRQRGLSLKSQRSRIDAVAAAVILQNYLDSKKNSID